MAIDSECATAHDIEFFTAEGLAKLVPGTNRKLWLARLIPALVAAGTLVKHGRRWCGSRAAIIRALAGSAS